MLLITFLLSLHANTVSVLWISAQQFLAATFFCIGYGLSAYNVKKVPLRVSLPIFVLLAFVSQFTYMECCSEWYDIKLIIPYMIVATISTWCIYSLPWYKMNKRWKSCMSYIGNNTLTILIWHALSFRVASWFLIKLYGFPNELLKDMTFHYDMSGKGWVGFYVVIGVGLPLLLTYLCRTIMDKLKTQLVTK